MTVIASGLGAQLIAKAQASWGGAFMASGKSIPFKTAKVEIDPHVVQGAPYLAGGQLAALASTRVLTWTDAHVTITSDVFNTANALLLICAIGAGSLTQISTGTAYGIGGAGPQAASAPDLNSTWMDMQINIPTDDGTLRPFNFHSGVVQKAEWVFDRGALVSQSYDLIFQYVETATSALTYTALTSQQPFSLASTATAPGTLTATQSGLAAGTYNSEATFTGMKKMTVTLDRKFATEADRMYAGFAYQQSPVTNDYPDLSVSIEADYTAAAKTGLFDLLLSGSGTSLVAQSVGSLIVSSYYNLFKLQIPSFYVDNPDSAPSPDGPKLVGSTITGKAHIDSSGDPWFNLSYVTSDTTT